MRRLYGHMSVERQVDMMKYERRYAQDSTSARLQNHRKAIAAMSGVKAPERNWFEKFMMDPENQELGFMIGTLGLGGETRAGGGATVRGTPALRQESVSEVTALASRGEAMRKAGFSAEEIARKLSADRRAIGVKYKDLTPPDKLAEIYARNERKYGDRLGPTVESLRKRGDSWEQIIESASRAGGKDLGF